MKNYILTTQNLTKTYGKKDAAKDISIHVREGEIYGLIGRNGAGKSVKGDERQLPAARRQQIRRGRSD